MVYSLRGRNEKGPSKKTTELPHFSYLIWSYIQAYSLSIFRIIQQTTIVDFLFAHFAMEIETTTAARNMAPMRSVMERYYQAFFAVGKPH